VVLLLVRLLPDVFIQRIVEREFLRQSLFVAYPGKREALSDRAQSETLAAEMLLSFHVGPANDQRETVKHWITEAVVLQKGLKRTALST